ncbi:tetratricopeptide repeat protein [Fictibacillus sp. 18YEL24]|uniref:tetratricopeptide repeat protein n=1 Tax=Fictibacillus sp. 18YEL24 TaxID=2745875 RepID=UPI0018CED687|nr:tetratricopeptide repeat protein [Fictibacillus sp. 18YEL24]MBH0169307.1 sel1 repeat family protein [Fictibacillus sp. 18YEL24]
MDFSKRNTIIDYGAIKCVTEFCYQTLINEVSDENNYIGATIYVDTGNVIKGWDFIKGTDTKAEDFFDFFIENADVLEQAHQILVNKLPGLSSESLKTLATIIYQKITMPSKSQYLLSYTGKTISYFSVIEEELRNILMMKNIIINKQKVMWYKIADYLEVNRIEHLHDSLPSISETMKKLKSIRNKAAHEGFISLEEFEQVEKFAVIDNALGIISYTKLLLRTAKENENLNDYKDEAEFINKDLLNGTILDVIFEDPKTLYEKGMCFRRGIGVKKNDTTAAEYFFKSAAMNHEPSLINLGILYFNGSGVPKDLEKSFNCFKPIAEKRDSNNQAIAQFFLGLIYREFNDEWNSFKCFERSANNGYPLAINTVAKYYLSVENFNFLKALKWSKLSLTSGAFDSEIGFLLGRIYYEGEVVSGNLNEAKYWFKHASIKGHVLALEKLNQVLHKEKAIDKIKHIFAIKITSNDQLIIGKKGPKSLYDSIVKQVKQELKDEFSTEEILILIKEAF